MNCGVTIGDKGDKGYKGDKGDKGDKGERQEKGQILFYFLLILSFI
jgi:hypothetical protein